MRDDFSVPPAPHHYDPLAVFAAVFADVQVVRDLADAFTCDEVNVLAALLAAHGDTTSAERWLAAHRHDCGHDERH